MDNGVIGIIIIAFLGPILVYLTRYVLKGRRAAASRLWFVAFCTYVVYYFLAQGYFINTRTEPFYFALLWPIPAVLAFWLVERTASRQSPIPLYRWMIYFLIGVVFAFLLDTAGNSAGWYVYNATVITSTAIANPVSGSQAPAIVWFMLGVLMAGVFFLSDNVYEVLKRKIGVMTTNYVLIALAFILGGLVYAIGYWVMGMIK